MTDVAIASLYTFASAEEMQELSEKILSKPCSQRSDAAILMISISGKKVNKLATNKPTSGITQSIYYTSMPKDSQGTSFFIFHPFQKMINLKANYNYIN